MLANNLKLMQGLLKAIDTLAACDDASIELGTITVNGTTPSFTVYSEPGKGPELPFGAGTCGNDIIIGSKS